MDAKITAEQIMRENKEREIAARDRAEQVAANEARWELHHGYTGPS